MNRKSTISTIMLCLLAIIPLIAQVYRNNQLLFVANLDGLQEVPSVSTNGRGVVSFLVSEDRNSMTVHGVFSKVREAITACKVNIGFVGETGTVLADFKENLHGNRLHAEVPMPENFLSKALKGELYLNVYSPANPDGEIRGQLVLKTNDCYVAFMTGQNEVPPVSTPGTGIFSFNYSPPDYLGSYNELFTGLSGTAFAGEIHSGNADTTGPLLAGLTAGLSNTFTGNLNFLLLGDDFEQKLKRGELYVNVPTGANLDGEIRGQLLPIGPIAFDCVLSGDQETPAVTTAATGIAVASLSAGLDSLTYILCANGLIPTAVNFNFGVRGVAGTVVAPLASIQSPGTYGGKIAVNDTQITNFLNGEMYVNILTTAHPNGEIRGQVEPFLRRGYAFDLCGEQEVPPTISPAIGAGVVTTDRRKNNMDFLYIADGLSGLPTATRIQQGGFSENGVFFQWLISPHPAAEDFLHINESVAVAVENNQYHLNIRTAMYPNGEIRGQIRQVLSCFSNVAATEPMVTAQSVYPNPTSGDAEVKLELNKAFEGQLVLFDLNGRVIFSENHAFSPGAEMLELHIAPLPPGLYFAQIRSAQYGIVAAFKVVRE